MRLRNSRVRTKVTALLASLIALWAFAAWVTLREGLNVLSISELDQGLGQHMEQLVSELQQERRLTLVMLGDPNAGDQQRNTLAAQRKRSEAATQTFYRQSTDGSVRQVAGDAVNARTAEVYQRLQSLAPLREQVDTGQADRIGTSEKFSGVIDSLYRVFDSLGSLDDQAIAKDTRVLIEMARARELLAQEDAFAAGALTSGRFTAIERAQFSQMVGAQRFLTGKASSALPKEARASFDQLKATTQFKRLVTFEDLLIETRRIDLAAPIGADRWKSATQAVLSGTDRLIVNAGDALVERATPVAVGVILRLILAGGLGLLAVIASIILSITTARALVRRLEELRIAALDLAARRLPSVVERLGRGDEVDVAAEAPALAFGNDAIGQVGQAFNTVQETAIRVAVEQAELRRSYRAILLSLARRTQSLVHRQLTILDAMERRETEPGELSDLFRVDHLATRMRRNAENLIVLSGAAPARAWRRSVPMVDVVRGALAEVEDYTQVTLMPMGEAELAGRAIGDVIHLLAELIENAVSFSPPYATVQVNGQEVANGYVVEIEDRGLGMNPADLAAANERIADPPEFKLTGTPRLGLFVVSRLASRHHIQVTLKASPYGGTTVVVLLPRELIDPEAEVDVAPDTGPPTADALPLKQLPAAPATPPQGMNMRSNGHASEQVHAAEQNDTHERADRPEWFQRLEHIDRSGESEPSMLTALPPWPEDAGARRNGSPAPETAPPHVPDPTPRHMPESTSEPTIDPESGTTAYTPGGLPLRVAQAHIVPALRSDTPLVPGAETPDDDDLSPEEIRRLMESFQSGTERGRSEAAKLTHPDDDSGPGDELPKRRR